MSGGGGSDDGWWNRFVVLTACFWKWLPASPGHSQAAEAVGVLCTLAAVIFVTFGSPSPPTAHVTQAAFGELRPEILPGGTRVLLGPGSWMNYDPQTRRANLWGNAQFIVKHDPERPIEVCAGGLLLRDAGTIFDVSAVPGLPTEMIVKEGSVRVLGACDASGEPIPGRSFPEVPYWTAGPREKITVSNSSEDHSARKVVLTGPELENSMAWSERKIHCGDQQPLSTCVESLNRLLFPKQLFVADPSLRQTPVSIRFVLGRSDLNSVLESLKEMGIVRRVPNSKDPNVIELVSKPLGTTSVK
jgi:ferric-dicitrate binding protein FerR (iron transport regulator)